MARIPKKTISRKKKQPREVRSNLRLKATKTKVGDGPPINSQGSEGEINVRLVDGKIKLYAKFRRKWYSVELS